MEIEIDSIRADRIQPRKPLILVVDDDLSHHKLLELLAEQLGIMVCVASSCADAINSLGRLSIDAIMMDCRMPHVDGHACTKRIRVLNESTRQIPIIAVTANLQSDNQQKCMDCGMDDFLGKPFTIEELHDKLWFWLKMRMKAEK